MWTCGSTTTTTRWSVSLPWVSWSRTTPTTRWTTPTRDRRPTTRWTPTRDRRPTTRWTPTRDRRPPGAIPGRADRNAALLTAEPGPAGAVAVRPMRVARGRRWLSLDPQTNTC